MSHRRVVGTPTVALPVDIPRLPSDRAGVIALIPCSAPTGMLEPAPLSALVAPPHVNDRWAGYWGNDDVYYARCESRDYGLTRWYRLGIADAGMPRLQQAPRRTAAAPVRRSASGTMRTSLVLVRRPGTSGRYWSVVASRTRR